MGRGEKRKMSSGNNGTITLPGFFEVEAIREKRVFKGSVQYLVKWVGWPESDNTWEPPKNLKYCIKMVEDFEESLKESEKTLQNTNPSNVAEEEKADEVAAEEEEDEVAEEEEEEDDDDDDDEEENNNGVGEEEEVDPTEKPAKVVPLDIDDHEIERIIRMTHIAPPDQNHADPLVYFLVIRDDGEEVTVTNKYLHINNPRLLIDYYEEHIRVNLGNL